MDHCVRGYDEKRIQEINKQPYLNHFDVGGHGQGIESRDEEGGEGHQDGCIHWKDNFIHARLVQEVRELVDDGQNQGWDVGAQNYRAKISGQDDLQPYLWRTWDIGCIHADVSYIKVKVCCLVNMSSQGMEVDIGWPWRPDGEADLTRLHIEWIPF